MNGALAYDMESGIAAHAEHDLGVDEVLGAAKRDEMNGPGIPHSG